MCPSVFYNLQMHTGEGEGELQAKGSQLYEVWAVNNTMAVCIQWQRMYCACISGCITINTPP